MENYAINGYEVGASDYIVKPISYPVFATKIRRITERIDKKSGKILLVTSGGTTRKIPADQIRYAEVIRHRLYIYTGEEEITVNMTLSDFEKELAQSYFVKCNSGILVNLKYVSEVNSGTVTVAGKQLPVSRSKYKGLMKELTDYVGNNN